MSATADGQPGSGELVNRFDHDHDHDRYRLTMDLAAVGIAHVSPEGRYLEVNSSLCDLLGYTQDELVGMTVWQASHPDDVEVTRDVRSRLHDGTIDAFCMEKRYLRKDGRTIWVQLDIAVRRDRERRVLYDIAVFQDISARKGAEALLVASEQRFKSLADLSSDWYWEADVNTCFSRVEGAGATPEWQKIVGLTGEAAGLAPDSSGTTLSELLHQGAVFHDRLFTLGAGRSKRSVSISGEPLFGPGQQLIGFRGVARDITSRVEAEDRIRYLASHDSLTGLPNRGTFTDLLSHAIASADRYRRSIVVAFVDLDRFKLVNDSLGHTAGDRLLCEIAARLRASVRESDVVARLGGDEFVVLLQECQSRADISTVADKMLDAVLKPFHVGRHEWQVSASIGLARYPSDGNDASSLMKNADQAMYLAKESGKNNHQFYTDGITSQAEKRLTIEFQLRSALDKNELFLAYQAKLDVTGNRISGIEALLRWSSPLLGTMSPAELIPIAEETGLILPIGRWVLREACQQSMAWQAAGLPPVRMAVNLSPRQFAAPNLADDIIHILDETGLAPELLELEVTESAVMPNPDRAVALLNDLKAIGVRITIDDFGTGYSSLSRLKRLPIDTLKVDRDFISQILNNAEDKAITEAIIAMGKTLNLRVVAEGVESADQLDYLGNLACDEIQGFYFSRPQPPERLAEMLAMEADEFGPAIQE